MQLAKSSYLHPLGQQLGIFRGLLLVLLSALPLQSNATALVLQHAGSYQSLDPGSFSSGFLACRKTIIPNEQTVVNWKIALLLDAFLSRLASVLPQRRMWLRQDTATPLQY